jgi:OOP family OmpA-OmpF porin
MPHAIRARLLITILAFFTFSPLVANALNVSSSLLLTGTQTDASAQHQLPVSAYNAAQTRMLHIEGPSERRAYTISSTSLTTLQILAPLRVQLESDGFTSRFACADSVCGGFDFRYALDLLPEPAMHVDLGDFQYIVAQHNDGRTAVLVISRVRTAAYIHITTIGTTDGEPLEPALTTQLAQTVQIAKSQAPSQSQAQAKPQDAISLPIDPQNTIASLIKNGFIVLEDLVFKTGSSTLSEGPFVSLAALADYLKSTPTASLILVGHTDATGSLEGNIALSRKRATATKARLMETYSVNPRQLSSDGVGYLAPRASNATTSGLDANRRVEAVLMPAQ